MLAPRRTAVRNFPAPIPASVGCKRSSCFHLSTPKAELFGPPKSGPETDGKPMGKPEKP